MTTKKDWLLRILLGGALGAACYILVATLVGSFDLFGPSTIDRVFFSLGWGEPRWLGTALDYLLWCAFGAEIAVATLPFADEGADLLKRSLLHFALMMLTVGLWAFLVFSGEEPPAAFFRSDLWYFLVPVALIYVLIWLGRWVGWYAEAAAIREKLGLTAGPSPLKWRETLPHLGFAALLCILLPLGLWLVDASDVPVLCGLLHPYVLLPVGAFSSALSLGKRQGFCPLYPLCCGLFCLVPVLLLMNSTALFHCAMAGVPALLGNLLGAAIRRWRRQRGVSR